MESFGAYLRSLREQNGKTLEELSNSTKIAVTNLDFLENDRYDLLPPKVFVKGFIRSYVKDLGLDPEDAVEKFDTFIREGEMPDYMEQESSVLVSAGPRMSFIFKPWFTKVLTILGLISLVILILTGVTRLLYSPSTSSEVSSQREPQAGSQKALKLDSNQGVSLDSQQSRSGKKVLEVKASGHAWVRVEPDGAPPEEFLMAPGDIQVFSSNKGFRLMTGNAGGIRIKFDGRVLPPLGKNNQTLSLSLP